MVIRSSSFGFENKFLKTQKEFCASWTHLKEIPDKSLLVSLHHSAYASANLEIFELAQKGQAKKVYSFEEVRGGQKLFVSLKLKFS